MKPGGVDVDRSISADSEGATDTEGSATEVLQAANDVSSRSASIRAEVEEFLAQIRVA